MTDSRTQALKQLKLKTVIKESHCSPVQHLDVNLCDADCRNLFATVAKDQTTIYDDMHMGDHVAVVGNLSLSNSVDASKDVFHTCCWIKSAGLSQHPYGDVLLAVGGSDPFIHIISVVQSAVVGQLPLPAGTAVAELSAASECPGLLLVLSRDGTLQLWQISSGACFWSCKTDAFTAAIHPDGRCVLTSSRAGKLTLWDISGLDTSAAAAVQGSAAAEVRREAWLTAEHPDSAVDCIRFLTGDLVCLKTADGHMSVHSWPSGKLASSWKVPGCGSSSTPSYSKRSCFGHTRDSRFVCVGNNMATAYVYDTRTGRQVTRVEAIRVQGCVKACGLSEDCRHVTMAVGHGYLFRFESKAPLLDKGSEEEEEAGASGSDTEMADVEGVGAAETTEAQQGQPQQQQQQQQQGPPPPQQHCDHHHQQQQQQQQATLDEQLSGRPSDPATTPASLAQHQQEQYSPDWFGGLADMTAPNSTGSMAGIMGLGSTPQQGGLLADPTTHHQQQQQEEEGGMGGVQPKRQRLAGGGADDSPLVFRPTPCKQ